MNLLQKVLCLCKTPPIIDYNVTTEVLTLTSINGLSDTTIIPFSSIDVGVTEIVAGIGVTINPTPGVGVVTINAGLTLPPVEHEYATILTMQLLQNQQTEGYLQYVADDGTGEDVYYEYLGTNTGILDIDYRELTDPEVTIIINNTSLNYRSFIIEQIEAVPITAVTSGHISFEYDLATDVVTGLITNELFSVIIQRLIDNNPLCEYYVKIYNRTIPRRQLHLAKIKGFENVGPSPGLETYRRIVLDENVAFPRILQTDGFEKDDIVEIWFDVDNIDVTPPGVSSFIDLTDTPNNYGTPGQFVTTDGAGNLIYTSGSITVNYRGVVTPGVTNMDTFAPITAGDWWLSDATGNVDTGATTKGVFEGGVVVANVDMPLAGDVINTKFDAFVPFYTIPNWQQVLDAGFTAQSPSGDMQYYFSTNNAEGAAITTNDGGTGSTLFQQISATNSISLGSGLGTTTSYTSHNNGIYNLSQAVSGITTNVTFRPNTFNTTLHFPAPSAVGANYNLAIGVTDGVNPEVLAGTNGIIDISSLIVPDTHTLQKALDGGDTATSNDLAHQYQFNITDGAHVSGTSWKMRNNTPGGGGFGDGFTYGGQKGFLTTHTVPFNISHITKINVGYEPVTGYQIYMQHGDVNNVTTGFYNRLLVPNNLTETAEIYVPNPTSNPGGTGTYYLAHSVSNGVVGAPGVTTVEADPAGNIDISVLLSTIDSQSLQNALNGGESAISATSMHSYAMPVIEAVNSGLDFQLQAVADNRYNARLLMAPDTDGNVYLQHTNTNNNVFGRIQFNRTNVELFHEETGGSQFKGSFKASPIPTIRYEEKIFNQFSEVSFRPLDKNTNLWFPSPSGAADDFTLGIQWVGPTGNAIANTQGIVDLRSIGFGVTAPPTPTAGTGTTIDMSNIAGHYMNMASASGATSYTTAGAVLGGYAVCLVNAASITVDGGSAVLIPGDAFVPGVDMHMWVQYFGVTVQYYFAALT